MTSVLLAFDDVGTAVQLQEVLEAAGYAVSWDGSQRCGPKAESEPPDIVLLQDDGSDTPLADMVGGWRDSPVPPGLLVFGSSPAEKQAADQQRVAFVANTASVAELSGAIDRALALRYATGLEASSPAGVALRALGLATQGDEDEVAARVISNAGSADIEMVKEALRWHAHHYIAAIPERIAMLRERRVLQIPEIELVNCLDGTRTLQTLVKLGKVDAYHSARLIWALASIGATTMTPEPPDQSTLERRALAQIRFHLTARRARLERTTLYDVLEVTTRASVEEIDQACQMLALRYAPDRLEEMDLAGLAPLVEPLWQQIREARTVLRDPPQRGRYNEWLKGHIKALESQWLVGRVEAQAAAEALARGQQALVAGDVFKAVSDTAAACRHHPGHPDYEASLAYARYRANVQKGQDRSQVASRERDNARRSLAGHRPWPHALVALGILSAADNDADAARWHLREALTCNPNLPAAKQMLQRLR